MVCSVYLGVASVASAALGRRTLPGHPEPVRNLLYTRGQRGIIVTALCTVVAAYIRGIRLLIKEVEGEEATD